MKFKFKIQPYQTEAVENTAEVFAGQPCHDGTQYRRDLGKINRTLFDEGEDAGYRNHDIELSQKQLLDNIRKIQALSDLTLSESLSRGLGAVNLDIEMETGTGKTYVYIKTMFELNKRYGWSKFIVVVPSIAIREGVAKSFSMLEDHFMEHYGKKARFFVYNSSNLQQLDTFSSDAGLNVMIINTQAFAKSFKESANNKESRIIYSKRDEFASRRPIDVIAANRPIVIMDEPQKMEGDATQAGLSMFKPLFVLNYSATHKTKHDTIYALDALDAFKQKLVKKIVVKGFEVKNLKGTSTYLYLDDIVLSKNKPPQAKIELEVKSSSGKIRRMTKCFDVGDDLYEASQLAEYKGFVISDIDVRGGYVTFLSDPAVTIRRGEVIGDCDELVLQRIQIRETILSHFEKERELFNKGIKTLSLFFIDEVSKYKGYDESGHEVKGIFQTIFEEEYINVLNEKRVLFSDDYQKYLDSFEPKQIHKGYFSIDKRTGRSINSSTSKKSDVSDDISAYELILKNKEGLLNFDEPTRFIFSHSALREGWDNPNVFQICTLRHSSSTTAKRQEVGRGLRICVDSAGNRMDYETLGEDVHLINRLTVIANESYSSFTEALQRENREVLRERPVLATADYFDGKTVKTADGSSYVLTPVDASRIFLYLTDNGYIDEHNHLTSAYRTAVASGSVASLPDKLQHIAEGVSKLINSIFDPAALDDMVEDGNQTKTPENVLNDNFYKAEFKALWNEINHKYVYTVNYDSEELIKKSIASIDNDLTVSQVQYFVHTGEQIGFTEFGNERTKQSSEQLHLVSSSTVKYDLVGDIARGAKLTRRSVVKILQGINVVKLLLFKNNPEEFIQKVIKLIRDQKATMIVEHIKYNTTGEQYDSEIFTASKKSDISKAYLASKHITDYVYTDGMAEDSVEMKFAKALDAADEVCVYAKLPRSFQIPTPVGNYAPDWAIAFHKDSVKHIFFIAETKGSMESMELRGVEKAKIQCAKKLFNDMSTSSVRYHEVDSYEKLLEVMQSI